MARITKNSMKPMIMYTKMTDGPATEMVLPEPMNRPVPMAPPMANSWMCRLLSARARWGSLPWLEALLCPVVVCSDMCAKSFGKTAAPWRRLQNQPFQPTSWQVRGVYSDNDGGVSRPRETQGPRSETPHEEPQDKPGQARTSRDKPGQAKRRQRPGGTLAPPHVRGLRAGQTLTDPLGTNRVSACSSDMPFVSGTLYMT